MTRIPDALRKQVYDRAGGRCEYCLIHEQYVIKRHEVDHIRAEKHAGTTDLINLCLSCFDCNRHKGSDLGSMDDQTNRIVRLFNPRQDRWHDHFREDKGQIIPLTARGRVTERLLRFNHPDRVDERARLSKLGRYP